MTGRKVHSFKESLIRGNNSEAVWMTTFLKKYPEYALLKTDGRSHDFVIVSPFGEFTLELKSDSFDMTKTENMFIERWSSVEGRKPGGPWQSQLKGVDLFCYYFTKQRIMLTANVNKLILALDELDLKEKDLIPILNKGYTTMGWKVPRKALNEKGIITYCYLDTQFNGMC